MNSLILFDGGIKPIGSQTWQLALDLNPIVYKGLDVAHSIMEQIDCRELKWNIETGELVGELKNYDDDEE